MGQNLVPPFATPLMGRKKLPSSYTTTSQQHFVRSLQFVVQINYRLMPHKLTITITRKIRKTIAARETTVTETPIPRPRARSIGSIG